MPPVQAALTAARELVGPIVAMTITLAAVYAPVGIQGGLTGALFREFAFTLAGAVIVSGVVALTLSPMMAAKLLRAGDTSAGSPAGSTGGSNAFAAVYGRMLAGTLRYRPVVLVLWAIVALLTVPFYMLSQRELAPAEDQGVVFSIIQAAAERDHRSDDAVHAAGTRCLSRAAGGGQHLPDHVPDRRVRRIRRQAVERAHARPLRNC